MDVREIMDNGLFEQAVNLMDDNIREELHRELVPCTDEEFLSAYIKAHEEKFGESFSV